jgi:ATP-binding cassette subfamily B protein
VEKQMRTSRWLLGFSKQLKGKMSLAVCLGVISNLAVILIPMYGVHTLFRFLSWQAVSVGQTVTILVALGVIRSVCRYAEQYLNHDIAFRLLALVRDNIFTAIRKLGPARLQEKSSGDLVASVTSDVEALEVFFAHTVSPICIAVITSIFTVGYLATINPVLALILLTGQMLVGVIVPVVSYYSNKKIGDDIQEKMAELNQEVIESVESLQDIAQFQLEETRLEKVKQSGSRLNALYKKRNTQGGTLAFLGEIILIFTSFAVLFAAYVQNQSNESLVLATILSLSSFGPALALNGLGNALLTTLASSRRLLRLTGEKPDVAFAGTLAVSNEFTAMTMQNVTFAHEENDALLENVSLNLPKGVKIGIGGESGSGKSTLVKLLMLYWNPKAGRLMLNDKPLADYTEAALHATESVMQQATFIFDDTIKQNIAIGKANATDAEIKQAAQYAALDDWIMTLPAGYDTPLNAQSRVVSEGEKQRIGLARLFLHDAPLLLLDEPTSNLDYLNEQAILKTIQTEFNAKTMLLISHRETTLAIADQTYYLEKKQLVKKQGGIS